MTSFDAGATMALTVVLDLLDEEEIRSGKNPAVDRIRTQVTKELESIGKPLN